MPKEQKGSTLDLPATSEENLELLTLFESFVRWEHSRRGRRKRFRPCAGIFARLSTASAPSCAAASIPCAHLVFSCEREIRACAFACGDSVGRFASLSFLQAMARAASVYWSGHNESRTLRLPLGLSDFWRHWITANSELREFRILWYGKRAFPSVWHVATVGEN